jgi:hypothetical protein
MARKQQGSSLSGRVMFVAAKEAILALLRFYWPLLLPVLAAAAQYFSAVPWPYFVMVLAVTVAVSIWAVNQLRLWSDRNSIEDKLALDLLLVEQQLMAEPQPSGPCQYQLIFQLMSIHEKFLHFHLEKLVWEIADRPPKEKVEIEEDSAVLAPGQMYIHSPIIQGLEPDAYGGKYTIRVQYGRNQGEMEYEIVLSGTFKILQVSCEPETCRPLFRGNRMKYEISRL